MAQVSGPAHVTLILWSAARYSAHSLYTFKVDLLDILERDIVRLELIPIQDFYSDIIIINVSRDLGNGHI